MSFQPNMPKFTIPLFRPCIVTIVAIVAIVEHHITSFQPTIPLLRTCIVTIVAIVAIVNTLSSFQIYGMICQNLRSEIASVKVERQKLKTARDAAGNLLRVYTGASIINYLL